MSLNVEGSELEVLKPFPFDKYTFGMLTVEHNGEEPKRTQIRKLLAKNGYQLEKEIFDKDENDEDRPVDDWFVNAALFPVKGAKQAHASHGSGDKSIGLRSWFSRQH